MYRALVSVIVPIYKVEEYLRECIDSIINQTYKNLEIILVDDGSPDKCGEICKEYARNDSRITVYHKENGGLSDARNFGIDRCRGEYITFVDSDDVIKPNFVEALVDVAEKYEADMTICHCEQFRELHSLKVESEHNTGLREICFDEKEALKSLLYQKMPTGAPGRLFRRKLFDDIRFPFGLYYEDLATTYRIMFKCRRIVSVSEKLYGYRMRQGSIMRQEYSQKMMSCIPVSQQLFRDITEKFPDLSAAAASRAFSANRSIYLRLPYERKEERMKIWAEMTAYRKTVITDSSARKRERIAAILSYMGADLFHLMFTYAYRRQQMM